MATKALQQAVLATAINDCDDDPSTPQTFRVKADNQTLLGDPHPVRTATVGPEDNGKPTKLIVVACDHGAPIEMWINGLINYVMGVEWEDNFRFKWVEDGVDYTWTKIHQLNYQDGYKIDYNLICVCIFKFKPTMLPVLKQCYEDDDVKGYYYLQGVQKVEDKKRLKMWGRDLAGLPADWTLLLSEQEGTGTGAMAHMVKEAKDMTTRKDQTILFPNSDIVFLDHDSEDGKALYNADMAGYEAILSSL